jgi:hypothetical protein
MRTLLAEAITILHELKPIAKRIAGIETPHAGYGCIRYDHNSGIGEHALANR